MLRLFVISAVLAAVYAMTTVPPAGSHILYDFHHKKAMIVMSDGCYEYHLNHQDVLDAEHPNTKPVLEARMLAELATAINKQEMGHHHIDHMTQEIKTACASLPIYSWDLPNVATTVPTIVST